MKFLIEKPYPLPVAYGIWRLNAAFQLLLSWAESIQFLVLLQIYLGCILILSSYLQVFFSPCWFTCQNFESTPTFLHSGYMPCPSQSSRLNHPDYIRRTIQTMKFLIVKPSLLHILIPLGNLRILSSKNISLRSSLKVRDHAWHPYSTTDNIIEPGFEPRILQGTKKL